MSHGVATEQRTVYTRIRRLGPTILTRPTRYFVIASLLTLVTGLGVGLVAYYTGFSTVAFTSEGPDELRYVPAHASLVAYADVGGVMASGVRQKLRALAVPQDGQDEFERQTGIDIERDIDAVVALVAPEDPARESHGSGMVLARGRFDAVRIEAFMRERGASVEEYHGIRLITAEVPTGVQSTASHSPMSVAFLQPGVAAVGSSSLVRAAIDLRSAGASASILSNQEMMGRIRPLGEGTVWAVGRFDALTSQARLPDNFASQLPPITWFSISGRVDDSVDGVVRAETRDKESADALRDILRGVVAFGRLQTTSHPAFQGLIDGLELGGTDAVVTLSFKIPASFFDQALIADVTR
jgi:hypothetical protein